MQLEGFSDPTNSQTGRPEFVRRVKETNHSFLGKEEVQPQTSLINKIRDKILEESDPNHMLNNIDSHVKIQAKGDEGMESMEIENKKAYVYNKIISKGEKISVLGRYKKRKERARVPLRDITSTCDNVSYQGKRKWENSESNSQELVENDLQSKKECWILNLNYGTEKEDMGTILEKSPQSLFFFFFNLA